MKIFLRRFYLLLGILMLLLMLNACTTSTQQGATVDQKMMELQQQQAALDKQQKEVGILKNALKKKEQDLSEKILAVEKAADSSATGTTDIDAPLLPPDAKAGECYARVFVPPVYKTITKKVLKKAESQRIEVIPATYKMVEKRVLVSEASQKKVTIPAKYGTRTEKVLVQKSESIWRTSLKRDSAKASNVLLAAAKDHGINLEAARPGDCFHEHYLPPVFETEAKDELSAEESYRIEVVPA